MHMLSAQNNTDYKRMLRIFQEALDLQEHISVSLHQPEEVQKLVERSHAEEVIRWNAQTVAARLRVLADDILYHRLPTRFTMEKQIGALEKIARQHPDNPVGQFCYWPLSFSLSRWYTGGFPPTSTHLIRARGGGSGWC